MSTRAMGRYYTQAPRPVSFNAGGLEPGWIARLIRGDEYFYNKAMERQKKAVQMLAEIEREERKKDEEIAERLYGESIMDVIGNPQNREMLLEVFSGNEELVSNILEGKDPVRVGRAFHVLLNEAASKGINPNTIAALNNATLGEAVKKQEQLLRLGVLQSPEGKRAFIEGEVSTLEKPAVVDVSPGETVFTPRGVYRGLGVERKTRMVPDISGIPTEQEYYDYKPSEFLPRSEVYGKSVLEEALGREVTPKTFLSTDAPLPLPRKPKDIGKTFIPKTPSLDTLLKGTQREIESPEITVPPGIKPKREDEKNVLDYWKKLWFPSYINRFFGGY